MNPTRTLLLWALLLGSAMSGGCLKPVQRSQEIQRFQGYLDAQTKQLHIDPSKPLTLAECENLALKYSLDLRVKNLALLLQDEQVRLALSSGMPKGALLFSDRYRSNHNLAETGGADLEVTRRHEQFLTVSAIMPVLDYGLTYYSYRTAVDQRQQERLLIARAEQLLRRDVRVAYAQYAGAIRQERLFRTAYGAAAQVLHVAQTMEREHLAAHADTILIEAALAQSGLDLSIAGQRIEETRLLLSQLMSLPPSTPFSIIEDLPPLPDLPTAGDVGGFEDQALKARPELVVQDLARQISASNIRQQATYFFPHVDGLGSFNWSNALGAINPAFFSGGFQVTNSLLDGGATIWRYNLATKAANVESERTLLVSLGIVYEVDLRALRIRTTYETVQAARKLEDARREALNRIISLYKEGLEDEAGAARSLADLTIQATQLDQSQTSYLAAWYELEATVLPDHPLVAPPQASTQPSSRPAWPELPPILQSTSAPQEKGSQP